MNNRPFRIHMQNDNNLVIYDSTNSPVWASGTCFTGNENFLQMRDDGNFVMYEINGTIVWQTNTNMSNIFYNL